MSFDLAKSIILKEAESVKNDDRFDRLEIDFMGGEPLMNFDLIKKIVEWLEVEPLSVPFICFATTNGTLLDEDKKAWFKKHKDIMWLGASYDGSTEIQRLNRGVGENIVDFSFFQKTWPKQTFKLTMSKESLPNLAEGIIESQKKNYRLSASLAQGIDWNEDDAELYLKQLRILSNFYIQNPKITPINVLTKGLFGLKNLSGLQKKFCGTGVHMNTYDVDGKSYGCHMFSPIVLGDKALELSEVDWTCDTISDDEYCKECFLKNYCPTCMGFNYRYRDNLSKRDIRWCKMILAEAIASCEFQMKALSTQKSLNTEEAIRAQCALEAYPILKKLSVRTAKSPFKMACSLK